VNLALFVVAFFAAWTVRAFALAPLDRDLQPFLLRRTYLDGIRLLLWVAPVLAYLRYVDGADAPSYLRFNTPIDHAGLIRGVVISSAYLASAVIVNSLATGRRVASPHELGIGHWITLLVALPIACFVEEVLFRGFLLRKTWAIWGFWPANLLTSVLFAAIHWPGWLASGGLRTELAMMSLSVFVVGILLGYLLKLTGSLWPSVLVHVLNNASVSLLV
jgi:membrane protease YdiL (CAAX protease family)